MAEKTKLDANYTVKKSMGMGTIRVIAYVVLVLLSLMCLIWFYLLFINATRAHSEITARISFVPGDNLIDNLKKLFTSTLDFPRGILNSAFVAFASSILTVYFSMMTAFAVHAYNFKGKKAVHVFILAIMMIPTQVTALGFVQFMRNIHLHDTFVPLILPAIAAPVTFFYMKQYMDSTLPLSIIEAARIDGSGEFRTFNTIVMPMMKPAIAVQAIFCFVASWNNYFTPALILKSDKNKTLPILIATLRSADYMKFDMGQVYMMIMLSIFPVIVVYLALSKYIVGGVALGAVKG